MIDLPGQLTTCNNCNKTIPEGIGYHVGPNMWHTTVWTCGHERILECPDCYKQHGKSIPFPKCTVCGNGCCYT